MVLVACKAMLWQCQAQVCQTSQKYVFQHAQRFPKLRRVRAKRTRQRLLSSVHAAPLQETTSSKAESSCQTSIEGGDFLPMAKVEELTQMTAERTTEMMQRKFDSRLEDLLAKFGAERSLLKESALNLEKELRREKDRGDALTAELVQKDAEHFDFAAERSFLKESASNLEKELCREKARADALTAELTPKDAEHLEYVANDSVSDWEPSDPWLFLDKEELASMSQTCHDRRLLVEENTPFFSLAPTGSLPADR